MSTVEDLVEAELDGDEGTKPYVYQDSLGFWTIGTGILVDQRKGGGLRPEEIKFILRNRIAIHLADLRKALPWFNELAPARQMVLVCMAFQMGTAGVLSFHGMLAAAMTGDFKGAAAHMRDSVWDRQTHDRAERMADIMEKGQ
jgi:lysozyme